MSRSRCIARFRMRYSPFSKPLDALDGDDLVVLREVEEGWFIEYKSQAVKPVDFGKILSSFANQFGGWIFVGVREAPNKSLRADAFPGIPSVDVPRAMLAIREGAAAHVSTPILFRQKIIDGPVTSIGLPAQHSIIALNVLEGDNPPYVHSSGKIYRRIADSSDPKAETDRSVLDSMWKKSETISARLREWLLDPVDAYPHDNRPVGYLYLLSDRAHSNHDAGLTFRQFQDVVAASGAVITLDHVLHTQDGYLARHLQNNSPFEELASLRWFQNGNVRITVPMNPIGDRLPSAELIHDELLDFIFRQNYQLNKVLDFGQWSLAVMGFILHYFRLQDQIGIHSGMVAKVVFKNVRGCIPYVPMSALSSQLKAGGVPASADGLVFVPRGFTPESFIHWEGNHSTPIADLQSRTRFMAFQVLIDTLRSLGLGIERLNADDGSAKILIEDFFGALSITEKRLCNQTNTSRQSS